MIKQLLPAVIIFFLISALSSYAEEIEYEDVLKKAIIHSYDLQIADADIIISKSNLKQAKSDYFPTIKSGFNTEYLKDMAGKSGSITSVGNTVLVEDSKYQNLLTSGISYNLFDFGVRKRKVNIAKTDIDSKKLIYTKNLKELKLKILDLYTDILISYKEFNYKQAILPVYKDLYKLKERLYLAGSVSKIDVTDEAIRIAKTIDEITDLKARISLRLEDISYFTGEKYNPDKIEPRDFKEDQIEVSDQINYTKVVDYKVYELEILKKQAELQLVNREKFPKFGIYANYSFYGTDGANLFNALKAINDRNLYFGISSSLVPFDGFKNSANKDRISAEIKRLNIERDRKYNEYKNNYEKLYEMNRFYKESSKTKQNLVVKIEEKLEMLERLYSKGIIDKMTVLNQKIETMEQKLNLEKTIINAASSTKKLIILSEI